MKEDDISSNASKVLGDRISSEPSITKLQLEGIEKVFGVLRALKGVDLEFYSGEVHSILGENGAGKTTLVNTIAGLLSPTAGRMWLDGKIYRPKTPKHAMSLGVGMVHQNAQLISRLTVAENLVLGWKRAKRVANLRKLATEVDVFIQHYGFQLDPLAKIADLSVGEQQRVAILRTLIRGASVLILDEPTATLTPQETDGLFEIMGKLAEEGRVVIFITHKLREVMAISSRVTVLRSGSKVATFHASECDERILAREMLGRTFESSININRSVPKKVTPVLDVDNIVVHDDRSFPIIRDLSLHVNAHEIVGIAGVAGNGQRELSEAVTGVRPIALGSIRINGKDLAGKGAAAFAQAGVGHIPEDRLMSGIAIREPLSHNAIMKAIYVEPYKSMLVRGPWLRFNEVDKFTKQLLEEGRVSTSNPRTIAGNLSGGNIQRFLIARELRVATSMLVAVHPTRGLDVGAMELTWQMLLKARDNGIGILLISEDLDEIMRLSDRILVMYAGRIIGEFDNRNRSPSREELGLLMGGITDSLVPTTNVNNSISISGER